MILYGVESGSQRILDQMGRGMTLAQIEHTFQLTKKYGFETGANFMIGYLGETKRTFEQTVEFACRLDPDYAMFFITRVKPDSDLYREMKGKGMLIEDLCREYVRGRVTTIDRNYARIGSVDYSIEDLDGMLANMHMRFYFRPRKIAQFLKRVSTPKQFFLCARLAFGVIRNRLSITY